MVFPEKFMTTHSWAREINYKRASKPVYGKGNQIESMVTQGKRPLSGTARGTAIRRVGVTKDDVKTSKRMRYGECWGVSIPHVLSWAHAHFRW